jgi:hypothetical protein
MVNSNFSYVKHVTYIVSKTLFPTPGREKLPILIKNLIYQKDVVTIFQLHKKMTDHVLTLGNVVGVSDSII